MDIKIDFEKIHRETLKRMTAEDYALARNNAPCDNEDLELIQTIVTASTEATRFMLEKYHQELIKALDGISEN